MIKKPVMTVSYSTGLNKMSSDLTEAKHFSSVLADRDPNDSGANETGEIIPVEQLEDEAHAAFGDEILVKEERTVSSGTHEIKVQGKVKQTVVA